MLPDSTTTVGGGPPPPPATDCSPSSPSSLSLCLDSFTKEGRKIRVGDCALFKQPQDLPPFVGIICKVTEDKKGKFSLRVNRLYRPSDVKLAKGALLEAAPNEVFYSFHKDDISAALLLHPCRVAFLRKSVKLPPGIPSFVCRRVYDTENNCLRWLTDKDYINEQREEVDKLLNKTHLEMHGAVLSGGHSPKSSNGPTSASQSKPSLDSSINSASLPSHVKGKKREWSDQSTDSTKRRRSSKPEDGGSSLSQSEHMLKSEIAKITEKGELVNLEGVEKLVQLMQSDSNEKAIDLVARTTLVDVIAMTDRFDCLVHFIQHGGLSILDEWLQSFHKGKISDSGGTKENEKCVAEFLLAILRALDKLPVNLHALQTCNVGKSVNHLRTYKNFEIQKKSRTLVDTWKKRVEAEMNMNEAKSVSYHAVASPAKHAPTEASHGGNKRSGSTDAGVKSAASQSSASKNSQAKPGAEDGVAKSSLPAFSVKSFTVSYGGNLKDASARALPGTGTSDPSLSPVKEESNLRHPKSSNTVLGSAVSVVQKEPMAGKIISSSRFSFEKGSPTGVANDNVPEVPLDHGNNQRLIVKLPNTAQSPSSSANGGSFLEEPAVVSGKSSPTENHGDSDNRENSRSEAVESNLVSSVMPDICQGNDESVGSGDGNLSRDESHKDREDGDKLMVALKPAGSSSGVMARKGNSYNTSLSSINALIESCVKISQASVSALPEDDAGMNLLASVATGEILKSGYASPSASPQRNSAAAAESCSRNDLKVKRGLRCSVTPKPESISNNSNATAVGSVEKMGDGDAAFPSSTCSHQASSLACLKPDLKPQPTFVSSASFRVKNESSMEVGPDSKCEMQSQTGECGKGDFGGGKTVESGVLVMSELPVASAELEKEMTQASACSPVESGDTEINQTGRVSSSCILIEKGSATVDVHQNSLVRRGEDVNLPQAFRDENNVNLASSAQDRHSESTKSSKVEEDSGRPAPDLMFAVAPKEKTKLLGMHVEGQLDGAKSDVAGNVSNHHTGTAFKLEFDLNEDFPADDGNQGELPMPVVPVVSSAVHLPCPLATSVTVAVAAKGSFVPPQTLWNKSEPRWKGSAATSAFRPAELRKNLDSPFSPSMEISPIDSKTSKKGCPLLDFDLNVPDEGVLEDITAPPEMSNSVSGYVSRNFDAAGLVLDLNRMHESLDARPLASHVYRVESSISSRPPLPHGFSNGSLNTLKGFDLNDGPDLGEAGNGTASAGQAVKSTLPFSSFLPGARMNGAEIGSFSSWFPPTNSYPSITNPTVFPSRGEQGFLASPGPSRISTLSTSNSFGHEIQKSQILSSSPVLPFATTSPFQYSGFAFETGIPLRSNNTISGISTAYVDPSLGGAVCFPTMPSHLGGPVGVVPSPYPRPSFLMSIPGGPSSVGSDSRKWGSQLDLNTGPGGSEADTRDEKLRSLTQQHLFPASPAMGEEQLKMYQMAAGVGNSSGLFKRKE